MDTEKTTPYFIIKKEGSKNKCKVQWDSEHNNFSFENGSNIMYNMSETTLIKILKGELEVE